MVVVFVWDPAWKDIQDSLDYTMNKRQQAGFGMKKKQADVIPAETKDILWENGHIGDDSSLKLVHTLMYVIGVNFALRPSEHKALKIRLQLQVSSLHQGTVIQFPAYTQYVCIY